MGHVDMDVEETGTTLGENSILKVKAYAEAFRQQPSLKGEKIIILSDDTGLEIVGLGGEPGIHVRRWKDHKTRMGDEEIIEYALGRMGRLKGADRAAQFRAVVTVGVLRADGTLSEPIQYDATMDGYIVEEPDSRRMEGFPFASMFFVDEYDMMLIDMENLPNDEKGDLMSHREKAVLEALPFLQEELGN